MHAYWCHGWLGERFNRREKGGFLGGSRGSGMGWEVVRIEVGGGVRREGSGIDEEVALMVLT
jgi:hypothetical protein